MDISTAIGGQLLPSHSGSFHFSSVAVPREVLHPVLTEHSHLVRRAIRERVIGPDRGEIVWYADENDLPRFFSESEHIYSDKKATALICIVLGA